MATYHLHLQLTQTRFSTNCQDCRSAITRSNKTAEQWKLKYARANGAFLVPPLVNPGENAAQSLVVHIDLIPHE